jgi:hypothetical protein
MLGHGGRHRGRTWPITSDLPLGCACRHWSGCQLVLVAAWNNSWFSDWRFLSRRYFLGWYPASQSSRPPLSSCPKQLPHFPFGWAVGSGCLVAAPVVATSFRPRSGRETINHCIKTRKKEPEPEWWHHGLFSSYELSSRLAECGSGK